MGKPTTPKKALKEIDQHLLAPGQQDIHRNDNNETTPDIQTGAPPVIQSSSAVEFGGIQFSNRCACLCCCIPIGLLLCLRTHGEFCCMDKGEHPLRQLVGKN